jgi:acyl carrier protein
MNREEILSQIEQLFSQVVGKQEVTLTENSTASDVEEWDSLNHIQFISAVEKHYNIRFDLDDLLEFENIGDLITGIQDKKK